MTAILSLLILSASANVIDFTSLFYPLTTWPLPYELNCSKYMCDQNYPNWGNIYSTCIRYNSSSSTFLLKPCPNPEKPESYCPPLYDKAAWPSNCTFPIVNYTDIFPNEQGCEGQGSCLNIIAPCVNDFCLGLNITDICSSNDDCNPGLRCYQGKCSILLNNGEAGCVSDEDCINTCGCNRNPYSSLTGVCVPYFSIETGEKVLACNQYNSLLCATGQCEPEAESYLAKCVPGYQSPTATPVRCSSVEQCYAETSNDTYVYSDCVCGLNGDGYSYCLPFLGDPAGVDLLLNLKLWVESEFINGCNIGRRFNWQCMKSWAYEKFDSILLTLTHYNQFVQVQGNDECVQSIYTIQYYDAIAALQIDAAERLFAGIFLVWTFF